MFDAQGYRFNVGIVLLNERNQAFWGRRSGQDSWQFPQGGINAGESSEQAMWRELFEETGLLPTDVTLLGETMNWLYYRLPVRYRRRRRPGMVQCIGQKQKWFLLRLESDDMVVNLNASSQPPEFDEWCWIDYFSPPNKVVHFKRKVYRQALDELSALISTDLRLERNVLETQSISKIEKRKAPSFAVMRKD
ncbi:MAG: RNA pyrophosphohydrolase [Cardiobacteriaceae bacterium]|nr:RNA pyrophosphohydrolase [Cardiobacteriaceae bacterium]